MLAYLNGTKDTVVCWRGPTRKCLGAERSSLVNVETEPRMAQFTK